MRAVLPLASERSWEYADMSDNNIKMIVLDLDWTLLTYDKHVSKENRRVLNEAYKRGVKIVPASGRLIHGMPDEVLSLPFVEYAIQLNGGAARRVSDGETLFKSSLERETVIDILEFMMKKDCNPRLFLHNDDHLQRDKVEHALSSYTMMDEVRIYLESVKHRHEDLIDFFRNSSEEAEMINFVFNEESLMRKSMEELASFPGVDVTTGFERNCDVTKKGSSKGSAALGLGEALGIKPSEIMAFGDADNDISMIEMCGIGVAMGNAYDNVKERADFVTLSSDDDGVAYAVKRFLDIE